MVAGLGDQHPVVTPASKSTGEAGQTEESTIGSILPKEVLPQAKMAEWNTKNLSQRLAVDAACGVAAGCLVAPVVSMVDK
jgi:hypothetical protein